jgi:ketosteroid isomerase-like protein
VVDTWAVTRTNQEIVREALALYEREGFEALTALADPEIEIRMGAGINAGDHHGVDQALEFNADWEEAWSDARYELIDLEDVDDETLIAEVAMTVRGEGSGAEISGSQWWLFGVRDGRFTRWHLYFDRASALEAARE